MSPISIITHIPIYVWVILALLISRIIKSFKGGPVSVKKALLLPAVFIVWGLEKVVTEFSFPVQALAMYVVFAGVGTFLGYLLYSKTLKFEIRNEELFRLGSPVPGVVIILNFAVKFAENMAMAIDTELLHNLTYNMFYCAISGVTIGLFIGNVFNLLANQKKLLSK
ncbi:hypothetical protein FACS1894111_11260 [Clostridia bacterium]|nr:hypothetical protein FACS1894111_11260 [Clostridia bacterium]